MSDSKKLWLEVCLDEDDEEDEPSGYLYLPAHPGPGVQGASKRTVRLLDLFSFEGPDIYLDLDENNTLIGIEIT